MGPIDLDIPRDRKTAETSITIDVSAVLGFTALIDCSTFFYASAGIRTFYVPP